MYQIETKICLTRPLPEWHTAPLLPCLCFTPLHLNLIRWKCADRTSKFYLHSMQIVQHITLHVFQLEDFSEVYLMVNEKDGTFWTNCSCANCAYCASQYVGWFRLQCMVEQTWSLDDCWPFFFSSNWWQLHLTAVIFWCTPGCCLIVS